MKQQLVSDVLHSFSFAQIAKSDAGAAAAADDGGGGVDCHGDLSALSGHYGMWMALRRRTARAGARPDSETGSRVFEWGVHAMKCVSVLAELDRIAFRVAGITQSAVSAQLQLLPGHLPWPRPWLRQRTASVKLWLYILIQWRRRRRRHIRFRVPVLVPVPVPVRCCRRRWTL